MSVCILTNFWLLACHIPTFLSTHTTHISTMLTLFHPATIFFTFHSTSITHISTHITYLFYIFAASTHHSRCHPAHISTITTYHYASCHHANIICIGKTSRTTSFTSFHTVIAFIYACLVFLILEFSSIH